MNTPTTSPPVFTETQNMGRHWWWLMLLVTALAIGVGYNATPATAPWYEQLLPVVLGLVTGLALLFMRLETRLDAAGVHYRYRPLLNRWRHWPWSYFSQVYMRKYSPLGNFGGWGIRGLPGNLAYNVAGPHGLQLVFKSGNKLLLGTQRPTDMEQVLRQLPILPAAIPPTAVSTSPSPSYT